MLYIFLNNWNNYKTINYPSFFLSSLVGLREFTKRMFLQMHVQYTLFFWFHQTRLTHECIVFVVGSTCHCCNKMAGRYRWAFVSPRRGTLKSDRRLDWNDQPQSPQSEHLLPVGLQGSWVWETAGTGVSRDCFVVYTTLLRKVSVCRQIYRFRSIN